MQKIQLQIMIHSEKKAVRFMAAISDPANSADWLAFDLIQDIMKQVSFATTRSAVFCCFSHPVPISVSQDPFIAFHLDKTLVKKYMSPLLIGELAPDQPSFEPSKNVSISKPLVFGLKPHCFLFLSGSQNAHQSPIGGNGESRCSQLRKYPGSR